MRWEYISRRLPSGRNTAFFSLYNGELKEDCRSVSLKTGTKEQKILGRRGDDVMIDWGYFYMACDKGKTVQIGSRMR